jgi:hypothetical protein
MTYLDELSRELGRVGIRGSRRRRILAEVEDHLVESRDVGAFGEPRLVAQRFADELATGVSRRLAYAAFLALVPAGLVYALVFGAGGQAPDITSARFLPLGLAAAIAMLLAPQVSFAAALGALLRGWRLRDVRALPAAEVRILRRRAGVAIGSGALALAGVALYAYEYSAGLSSFSIVASVAGSAAASVPIVAAAVALRRAAPLRPATTGEAGDLCDDLGPLFDRLPAEVPASPWRICLALAGVAAVGAVAAAGPDEGLRNATVEVVAICGGFAALGRFLGFRR